MRSFEDRAGNRWLAVDAWPFVRFYFRGLRQPAETWAPLSVREMTDEELRRMLVWALEREFQG
jgi:hypothetical protein